MSTLRRPWSRSIRKVRSPRAYSGQQLLGTYVMLDGGPAVWVRYRQGLPSSMTAVEFTLGEGFPPTVDELSDAIARLAAEAGASELRFGFQAGPAPYRCTDGHEGAFVELSKFHAELRIWKRDRATGDISVLPGRTTRVEFADRVQPDIPLMEQRVVKADGSLENLIALCGALVYERDVVSVQL